MADGELRVALSLTRLDTRLTPPRDRVPVGEAGDGGGVVAPVATAVTSRSVVAIRGGEGGREVKRVTLLQGAASGDVAAGAVSDIIGRSPLLGASSLRDSRRQATGVATSARPPEETVSSSSREGCLVSAGPLDTRILAPRSRPRGIPGVIPRLEAGKTSHSYGLIT